MVVYESFDEPDDKLVVTSGVTLNVIAVAGELDVASKPALVEAIANARTAGATFLTLDMSGVTFMDSSGLGALIAAYTSDPYGSVRVVNPSAIVTRVLELTEQYERLTAD